MAPDISGVAIMSEAAEEASDCGTSEASLSIYTCGCLSYDVPATADEV